MVEHTLVIFQKNVQIQAGAVLLIKFEMKYFAKAKYEVIIFDNYEVFGAPEYEVK